MLYGFNSEDARHLKRVARREGWKSRTSASIKYPRIIPDDASQNAGWGRITGTLAQLGSQTCRVWKDVSGTMTDTGDDITVYDRLMITSATLTDKWRVRWQYDANVDRFYVIAAACSADTTSTWGT